MRRVAALVPNVTGFSPGQRVRIEAWSDHLPDHGWSVDLYPFENAALHDVLYQPKRAGQKALRLTECYLRQIRRLRGLGHPDLIFIFQEAALIGPALLERWVSRSGIPIVYDLDDPRFIPYRSPNSGRASVLKFPGKTNTICRLASHVIAINSLLADYASRYNSHVTVVPNSVDINRFRPGTPTSGPTRLVWIGSHSTASNLASIAPALSRLQADCSTPIRLIGGPASAVPHLEVESIAWSADTEVELLQEGHIGLVPVPNSPWNRWKFFLKTVQYMSVGLPVVAHPMGSNAEVITDGLNGFLAETQDEWYQRLRTLVDNPDLRRRMGAAARATAVERFSLPLHVAKVASVFNEVATSVALPCGLPKS